MAYSYTCKHDPQQHRQHEQRDSTHIADRVGGDAWFSYLPGDMRLWVVGVLSQVTTTFHITFSSTVDVLWVDFLAGELKDLRIFYTTLQTKL